ncbi:MAG: hypothetical protein IJD51_05845 [Clostridia bacterium]|nr:hypothetical protein [Clostridia bacterium]
MFYLYVIHDGGAGYYESHSDYEVELSPTIDGAASFPSKTIAEALHNYLVDNCSVSYCEVVDARQ